MYTRLQKQPLINIPQIITTSSIRMCRNNSRKFVKLTTIYYHSIAFYTFKRCSFELRQLRFDFVFKQSRYD